MTVHPILLTVTALVAATLTVTPAHAASGPWTDYYADAGKVTVSADRRKITVCDLDPRDDLLFKADFATDNPFGPSIYTVEAPRGECATDRTYVSWIKVFKLCIGRPGPGTPAWGDCNPSIWTRS
jgi:hypothetical protein